MRLADWLERRADALDAKAAYLAAKAREKRVARSLLDRLRWHWRARR
jgi:hypothetical protein